MGYQHLNEIVVGPSIIECGYQMTDSVIELHNNNIMGGFLHCSLSINTHVNYYCVKYCGPVDYDTHI